MAYKRLMIWVEGDDDELFFGTIIKPILSGHYDCIEIRQWGQMKKDKIKDLFSSFKSMNVDYWFVSDINNSPCITAKKNKLKITYRFMDEDRIIVVRKEIEGWYLGGVSEEKCKKYKFKQFKTTDHIGKEEFNAMIPKSFTSRTDYMIELLKDYSKPVAMRKNQSFKYFINKIT